MRQGEIAEIVWVKENFHLIDPESYERSYQRSDNRPLTQGYYIVTWPEGAADGDRFDESVEFTGPFSGRQAAEHALESGQCSGLPQREGKRKTFAGSSARSCIRRTRSAIAST